MTRHTIEIPDLPATVAALERHLGELYAARAPHPVELHHLLHALHTVEPSGTVRNRQEPTTCPDRVASTAADDHDASMTPKQAATKLGISVRTVERLIARGALDSFAVGRARRITPAAVTEYIAQGRPR
jgi:excisionase family DNA binding protein